VYNTQSNINYQSYKTTKLGYNLNGLYLCDVLSLVQNNILVILTAT